MATTSSVYTSPYQSNTPVNIAMKLNLREQLIDINKCINYLAPINSPALTGTPTTPTKSASTNDTSIASTKFVHDLFKTYYTNGTCIHVGNTVPTKDSRYTKYLWFDTTVNAECIKWADSNQSKWTVFGAGWK